MIPDKGVVNLNGTWKYCIDSDNKGNEKQYYSGKTDFSSWKEMAIPVNWYLLKEVGDYFGVVWFKTTFKVPSELAGKLLFLRFNAVDYYADVWLNGEYLGFH
jgi:beta-mannosidase